MVAKLLRTKTTLEDEWCARDTVTALLHQVPLQALYSRGCLTPHPLAHQDHFHKQRLLLSPHLSFSTHSPCSRSSQMYWKGSELWGRTKSRMDLMGWGCEHTPWQKRDSQHQGSGEMLEMQEEGQTNTAQSTGRQGGEGENTKVIPERCSSLPVQRPTAISTKNSTFKIFWTFQLQTERFQFLGKGTGFKSTGFSFFHGFLKTTQGKNSFWGLVSIYPTQNQPLNSQVLLMEGYYVHTQTSFSTHGRSVQRDYIKAVFPNQPRRTTHSPSTHIKKAFSLLEEKDTGLFPALVRPV